MFGIRCITSNSPVFQCGPSPPPHMLHLAPPALHRQRCVGSLPQERDQAFPPSCSGVHPLLSSSPVLLFTSDIFASLPCTSRAHQFASRQFLEYPTLHNAHRLHPINEVITKLKCRVTPQNNPNNLYELPIIFWYSRITILL